MRDAMHTAQCGIALASRLCLSVTLGYRGCTGWNILKIIPG